MLLRLVVITMTLSALAGCNLANKTSVYRETYMTDGRTLVLDNEQSAIIGMPARYNYDYAYNEDGSYQRDSNGDPIIRRSSSRHVICAQPAPDALSAASGSSSILGEVFGQGNASAAASAAESVANITTRTQSIQLLRDAFFRLCEGFGNEGIDGYEYGLLTRRFQSNMMAILAIEQLTGAVTGPSVVLNAGSNASMGDAISNLVERRIQMREDLQQAEARIEELDDMEAATAEEAQADSSKMTREEIDAELASERRRRTSLSEGIEVLDGYLENARRGDTSATTQAASFSSGSENTTLDRDTVVPLAAAVERITLTALNQDYTPQLCFEYLRLFGTRDGNNPLVKHCTKYVEDHGEAMLDRQTAIIDLYREVLRMENLTPDERSSMLEQISRISDTGQPIMRAVESLNNSDDELSGRPPVNSQNDEDEEEVED